MRRGQADGGWRQRGERASVMTRQAERMALAAAAAAAAAAYLILVFSSAGADGTDEAVVRDQQWAQVLMCVCSPGLLRPPPGPCAPLCRPQAEDECV